MTLIKCKSCKKEISSESKKCVHCGEPNIPETKCPECKKNTTLETNYCTNCGYPLKKETTLEETAKKLGKATKNVISTIADEFDKLVSK